MCAGRRGGLEREKKTQKNALNVDFRLVTKTHSLTRFQRKQLFMTHVQDGKAEICLFPVTAHPQRLQKSQNSRQKPDANNTEETEGQESRRALLISEAQNQKLMIRAPEE